MLQVYNKMSSLTLPNGKTKTAEELESDDQYNILFTTDCAVDVDDDGVTHSFFTISYIKKIYNIDSSDPHEVVNIANSTQQNEIEKKRQAEVEQEESIYENQEAIGELGVLSADSLNAIGELGVSTAVLLESNTQLTSANEDVLQAIGELGAMVAAMQVSSDTHPNVSGGTA